MRWSTADIADAVAAGLAARAAEDDAAQAVYGFDARDELGLHPLLHEALRVAGYGVHVEQRYPGHWHKRKKSEGLRCDVVLTPDGRPLAEPEQDRTLFAPPDAAPPESAYWLEVKTVAQFESEGAFSRYSAELLSVVADDVKKVWQDAVIKHGGLLLVLFTAEQRIAEHDLAAWHARCMERGYPVGPPAVRGFAINDRIGNAWCAVAVYGVRGV